MVDIDLSFRTANSVEGALGIIRSMYNTYRSAGPVVFLVATFHGDENKMEPHQVATSVWVGGGLEDSLLKAVVTHHRDQSLTGQVGIHAFSF